MPTTFQAESIAEAQSAIRSSTKIRIQGNGTKAISRSEPTEYDILDLSRLTGIIEYDSSEFTITVKAGTPLQELCAALAKCGQFLPFDPPLVAQGATVGGMIAAGISGPSRLGFGSVRDFVLGVTFVDGTGAKAMAGGKVVKNAAGFDIPKLLVGSWGELAAIVEVTLKVFPRPTHYCSIRIDTEGIEDAIALVHRLTRSPLDIDALDIVDSRSVLVRMGGFKEAISQGAKRVFTRCDGQGSMIESGSAEESLWSNLLDWTWCQSDESMVRVPLTTAKIVELDSQLGTYSARSRYSAAGNLAWIAWPNSVPIEKLDRILHSMKLVGRIVRGSAIPASQIGLLQSDVFASRIRRALDPENRFAKRT
jgi:glycolate oxidase FAD binding subunit